MRKIILLIVCTFGLSMAGGVSAATITKDQACALPASSTTISQQLEVKRPDRSAMNSWGYVMSSMGGKKLSYAVYLPSENGMNMENYLYQYDCATKKSQEVISLPSMYSVIGADSDGRNIMVLDTCDGCDGGFTDYRLYTISDLATSSKSIDIKTLGTIQGYNESFQSYLQVVRAEIQEHIEKGDILLEGGYFRSSKDFLKEDLSKMTVSTFMGYGGNVLLGYTSAGEPIMTLAFGFDIYATSDKTATTWVKVPSTILQMDSSFTKIIGTAPIDIASDSILSNEALARLHEKGLTKYDTLGGFRPDDSFTREQAAKFFSLFAINVLGKKPDTTKACLFNDIGTADTTLQQDIIKACQLGIFKGTKGYFYPKKSILAEEATAVLMRSLYGVSPEDGLVWYANYMKKALTVGLTPAADFTVGAPITRGAIGYMIYEGRLQKVDAINKSPNSIANSNTQVIIYSKKEGAATTFAAGITRQGSDTIYWSSKMADSSTGANVPYTYHYGEVRDGYSPVYTHNASFDVDSADVFVTPTKFYLQMKFAPIMDTKMKGYYGQGKWRGARVVIIDRKTGDVSVKDMGTNVIHLVSDDHIVYAPYIWESYGSDTETTIENINTAKKLLLTNIIPVSLDLQTNIFHYSQHEYDLVPMPSEECPPRNMGNVCIDGKIYNQENHRNTPKTIALP